MKKFLLSVFTVLLALPMGLIAPTNVQAATMNTAIRGTSVSTVFWYANDGKRYVFPTAQTFYSWFPSFDSVRMIPDSELYAITIGGNVTYRPGAKLVKINTDPRVYAVARGGVLRHVTSEYLAEQLYGYDWRTDVHDIADTYFTNYTVGAPIYNAYDYNVSNEYNGVSTPNDSLRGMTGTGSTGDLALNTSRTSINPGEAVVLSVPNTLNYGSGYRIEIYDTRTNGLVKTCILPVSTCETTVYPQRNASTDTSVQYYAALRDSASNTVKSGYSSVISFGNATGTDTTITGTRFTTTVSRATVTSGESVTLTATLRSGYSLPSTYRIEIQDPRNSQVLQTCWNVSSCSVSTNMQWNSSVYNVTFHARLIDGNGNVIADEIFPNVSITNVNQTGDLTIWADKTSINSGDALTLSAWSSQTYNLSRIEIFDERDQSLTITCYSLQNCSQSRNIWRRGSETGVRFYAQLKDWNGNVVRTAYTPTISLNGGSTSVPVITSPTSNQVLTNFPRTLSITWTGTARRHQVEIACPSCWPIVGQNANPGILTTDSYRNWVNTEITGDDTVTARVRAIDENGSYGSWSNSISFRFTTASQSGTGENRINGLVLNADRTSINPNDLVRLTAQAYNSGTWSYMGNRIEISSVNTGQILRTCYDSSTCTLDVYPQAQSSGNLTAQYLARIYDRNGVLAMSQYSPVIYLSGSTGTYGTGGNTISGTGNITFSPTENLKVNRNLYLLSTFTGSNLVQADAKIEIFVESQTTPLATCTGAYTCSVSYPTGSSPMTTRTYARLSNRYNASQWLETPRVTLTTTW